MTQNSYFRSGSYTGTGSTPQGGSHLIFGSGWQPSFFVTGPAKDKGSPNLRGFSFCFLSLFEHASSGLGQTNNRNDRFWGTSIYNKLGGFNIGYRLNGQSWDNLNATRITKNGVTTGESNLSNQNGETHYYCAIRNSPAVSTGVYVGTGGSNSQEIILGREPSFIIIIDQSPVVAGSPNDSHTNFMTDKMSQNVMPGVPSHNCMYTESSTILSQGSGNLKLTPSGFIVGDIFGATEASSAGNATNELNMIFTWIAFHKKDDSTVFLETGEYIGDGAASKTITLGRQPDFIWIYNFSSNKTSWKYTSIPSDDVFVFSSAENSTYYIDSNLGVTIISNGFTVGSLYNTNNNKIYWVAGFNK